jgi:subtilisin family serine protease
MPRVRATLAVLSLVGLGGLLAPPLAVGDGEGLSTAPAIQETVLTRTQTAVQYAPDRLVVGFEETASPQAISAVIEGVDGTVTRSLGTIDARVIEVDDGSTDEALASLEASPAVEYVEPEVLLQAAGVSPNDVLWPDQWGPKRVHAPAAWETTRGSAGVVVAVLDTGVDAGHADLRGFLVPGFDVVNNDVTASDDNGHGTAAAGVIAARTNNGVGQAGVCWNCSVMPVKVLNAAGSGTTSAIASGILWAVANGADVISMSLGGTGTTQALADAVAYAASHGVVLVAAAGNNGSTTPFYPAAYPQVISVAGTASSDGRYAWSNYGSWVQVAAPGCNVAPAAGGGYVNFCGTSSATPIVAGIAGLAHSLEPALTKSAFEQALRSSGPSLPGIVQYGRVDALGTLEALGLTPPINKTRPSIRGTPRVGNLLTAKRGRWSGSPTGYRYRWLRCNRAGTKCSRITRATGSTYRVRAGDLNSRLRVAVRALNANGGNRARSAPTSLVSGGTSAGATRIVSVSPTGESEVTGSSTGGAPSPSPPSSGEPGSCSGCSPPSTVDTIASEAESVVAAVPETVAETVDSVANEP